MQSDLDQCISTFNKQIFKSLNDNVTDDKEFYEIIEQYDKINNISFTFNIRKLKIEIKKKIVRQVKQSDIKKSSYHTFMENFYQ